jgi:Xaa-Pro dipeptidase
MSKYPAKSHALRVATTLKTIGNEKNAHEGIYKSLIYLAASKTQYWPHCDQVVPLRQNRYFNYLTGAHDMPDAHVTFDLASSTLTLYLPNVDKDDIMWSGLPMSVQEAHNVYDVDHVKYASDLATDLDKVLADGRLVVSVDKSDEFSVVEVSNLIHEALDETRLIKDEYELNLMRKASQITDNSHLAVMSALPIETNEGHIHAEFVYHSMRQGSKNQAYDPICCAGTNCGTLHYLKNNLPLDNKLLVLIDAGAEWQAYASDVTRVFPINGEWTKEALEIYETVRDMQSQTMAKVAPGVSWDSLHELSHRILVEHFLRLGIFKNGTMDEIVKSRVSVAFYPHGLGHLLGMDTHDCGGRANYEDPDPMFRYLRIRRNLQENMVVTVEPGCYFNNFLLEPVFANESQFKYIDRQVLDRYMSVGGVRIEDDVVVTKNGFEDLTKITKDPKEIARIVKAGIQKGRNGYHVVV